MNDPRVVNFTVESGLAECGHPYVRITVGRETVVLDVESAIDFSARIRDALQAVTFALEGQAATKGRTN